MYEWKTGIFTNVDAWKRNEMSNLVNGDHGSNVVEPVRLPPEDLHLPQKASEKRREKEGRENLKKNHRPWCPSWVQPAGAWALRP